MLQGIQQLGRGQRIVIFASLMIGGLLFIVAIAAFLILISLNTAPRTEAQALLDGVQVAQFAVLPDADAYPGAVAIAPDGTIYTGSYATGAVWAIAGDKPLNPSRDAQTAVAADADYVREIPGSRDLIGSVRGLTVGADGTLYVLDGVYSDPRGRGGLIWVLPPGGTLTDIGAISMERITTAADGTTTAVTEGMLSPKDIAIDAQGNLYVTDRGFREVWKITRGADGAAVMASVFWMPSEGDDERLTPTGIAYLPDSDSLVITDSEANTVYRVPVTDGAPEVLYRHTEDNPPGFGGVTRTPDGVLYIAALDQNGLVRLENGVIQYVVGLLRGASDVAATADGRLIATNFDSAALVLPGVSPQLPFALDEVRFTSAD